VHGKRSAALRNGNDKLGIDHPQARRNNALLSPSHKKIGGIGPVRYRRRDACPDEAQSWKSKAWLRRLGSMVVARLLVLRASPARLRAGAYATMTLGTRAAPSEHADTLALHSLEAIVLPWV